MDPVSISPDTQQPQIPPIRPQLNANPWIASITVFLLLVIVILSFYRLIASNREGFNGVRSRIEDNQSSISTVPKDNIQWASYSNSEYGFTFQYPVEMLLEEERAKEPYYDLVAEFATSNYGLSVSVIHDIDIYENSGPEDVAKREVADSGFKYTVTGAQLNGLRAAKTTMENLNNSVVVTLAHPTKNIFVAITFSRPRLQLDDQILSTFKFTN